MALSSRFGVLAASLLLVAIAGKPSNASELDLQRVAQRALGPRAGSVVALDARNGQLQALLNPRVAAASAYPVGSLAKLVTGMAALDAGLTDGARRIRCKGQFERWKCWRVHGEQTFEEAIANSCSTYFFTVGRELGGPRLNRAFQEAGFGRKSGSDLADEAAGKRVPARTLAEVTELAYGDTPALLATPLQVASWMGAIANSGTRYAPHLAPTPTRRIGSLAEKSGLDLVRTGMRRAVLDGSAQGADVPRLAVHGKTGTATHLNAVERRHGWFAGFAEHRVVVVFVKEGSGYDDAAPIAREVFDAWP
ncbi:Stage V sporulation protein D [compost metagenome]